MTRREQIEEIRVGYRNKFKAGLINLDEALSGMAQWADANPDDDGCVAVIEKLAIAIKALNNLCDPCYKDIVIETAEEALAKIEGDKK